MVSNRSIQLNKEYQNISRYDRYRLKIRVIHKYVRTYSDLGLILTDGEVFYRLENQQAVWSRKVERYCKTVFDYDIGTLSLQSLAQPRLQN